MFPQEELYLTCNYTSSECAPKEFKVECNMRAVQDLHKFVGSNYAQEFTVVADTGFTELCVSFIYTCNKQISQVS